jgi:hypothetical protein
MRFGTFRYVGISRQIIWYGADNDPSHYTEGKSGNDLGTGLTGCDGGIDKRPHEKGFLASLSSPISGKTEVTRELD